MGIIGPYFFEEENHAVTVNSERYIAMIHNFFAPAFAGLNVQDAWFQQDGAIAHTSRASMQVLREMFPGRLLSLRGDISWPARSPDLTPCDFFLWGYLKAEVFKVFYTDVIGEENAFLYRTWLYLSASASAEFFADIALSPMEAAKVKIQTTPGFANTLREAWPRIYREEGMNGFYKSLVPLWMRQIPYTMMKFACFERTVELLYKHVVPKPRAECSKGEQLVVTFAAGYIAGVFCAIVSHPADTVVSKLNQEKGSTALEAAKKLGMAGLWKGLTPRIVMIGTLTALQWFIYDAFKVAMRMPRPPPPEMPESLKKKLAAQGKL
ncbi:phosphate carrier protein, mitochondrial-like isoform X1 [Anthonomus grandis grandis]|uniref:phosphate carrier protein, mitochondrial-like isoform X1 n=1 Tax=Anthonomus grandis grandis TaxID=2921223 RepID=UPI002165A13C|nr:phosphate carrier protein, mitochondrial-like isoform X1 [Anthonomus grandis grandis]